MKTTSIQNQTIISHLSGGDNIDKLRLTEVNSTNPFIFHDTISIKPDSVDEWYFGLTPGQYHVVIKNRSNNTIKFEYKNYYHGSSANVNIKLHPGSIALIPDYDNSSLIISFSSPDGWSDAEIWLW